MKKITSLILALVLTFSLVALSACGDKTTDDKNAAASDDKVITVGASATPHAEILEQIKQALADEGYELKIVTYDDYVLPNRPWPTAHSTPTTSSISPTSTASTPRTAPTLSLSAPSTMSRSASTATASPT